MSERAAWDDGQTGESQRAHAAFLDYCRMGPARSLRGLLARYVQQASDNPQTKPPTLKWTTLSTWSDRFYWQARVALWDAEQQRLAEESYRLLWYQRRKEWMDKEFEMAKKLLEKAERMLDFPLAEREVEQDGQKVIVKPARWNMASAARMVDVASKLARLATGMVTENYQFDFGEMSDEELDAYIINLLGETGFIDPRAVGEAGASHGVNGHGGNGRAAHR